MTSLQRILHVDDEPNIREIAVVILEDIGGFTVETCGSGREALDKVPSFAPDLILLDVMMPGMDGPTTLRELRKLPQTAQIPVIFMTAKVQAHEIDQYFELGAIGVVTKPFDPMTLCDQIREIWQRQAQSPKRGATTMTADSARDKLRLLQHQYAEELPARLGQVMLAWKGVQKGGGEEARRLLYRLLHTLAGSGTTFGYAELSATAGRIGERLHRSDTSGGLPEGEEAAIDALIAQLREDGKKFSEAASPLSEQPWRVRRKETAAGPDTARRTVFLFEDDTILANEVARQIGHYGYDVQLHTDPSGLALALQRVRPAAILMDIVFAQGELAGTGAVRGLDPELVAGIPVLFLSMRSDLPARLEAVRAGARAYFVKPLDVGVIVDRLDKFTSDEPPEPFRILIVDDSPTLARFTATVLSQDGMETRVVTEPMTLLENLSDFHPELILMDMYMPDCTGEELAAVVRQHAEHVSIPIVYLSGEMNRDKQLHAMMLGGEEFLTKPIQADHLVAAVSIRAERYRVLRSFMERDSLTGLLNHTKIKAELDKELGRAKRRQAPLSFAMLDIDKFKLVNDSYGHPVGDRVIRALARLLQQRLRKTDIVGRYGGEEFAVVLTDTDAATALEVMDKVREAFAQVKHLAGTAEFAASFSCGIASYPALAGAAELGNAADRALYAAKHAGRNKVVLFEKG